MRGTISLLVITLVFGCLGLRCESVANSLSDSLTPAYGSQHKLAETSEAGWNPRKPEDPAPHRGSGRRDLMEYFVNTNATVS